MYLKQGTVLASGWEGDQYKSKPSGNHVVVFDKYRVDGQCRLGMYVAEQLANKRGHPVYSFKIFGVENYVTNASKFYVVTFMRVKNARIN
jgi:hypothetical protein